MNKSAISETTCVCRSASQRMEHFVCITFQSGRIYNQASNVEADAHYAFHCRQRLPGELACGCLLRGSQYRFEYARFSGCWQVKMESRDMVFARLTNRLYSVFLANVYSRLGRYPSFTIDLWNSFVVPFVKKTNRNEHDNDLEKGMRPTMQRSKSSRHLPRRIEARVGYDLASAAIR